MFQVRIHGRGGQGVVTAAEVLSVAAFLEGRHAQAFPSFGSERTGAPVVSFCRIDDRPLRVREPIGEPDAVLVQDATLLHQVDLFAGLRPDGWVLVNSTRDVTHLGLDDLRHAVLPGHLLTVPASELAQRFIGRPLPNAALLGGFTAAVGVVGPAALEAAIRDLIPAAYVEGNVAAARAAHDHVAAEIKELADA
jgi:pyruvate ferredoxin oxidoreductase gamma subunit